MSEERFEQWVILELMGHRRLAGYLTERTIGGASMLQLEVPAGKEGQSPVTQLYSPGAVYCITPTTEEIARALAGSMRPEPVHRWELDRLLPAHVQEADFETERLPGEEESGL